MTKVEADQAEIENWQPHFRVDNGKANLAPAGGRSEWYRIVSVDPHNGTFADEGDSIGVVERWKFPSIFEDVQTRDFSAVQAALIKSGKKWKWSNQAPKDWFGDLVGEVLRLDPKVKATRAKITKMIAVWIRSGAFKKVICPDEKTSKPTPYVEMGT
jgi:hypothetical protein